MDVMDSNGALASAFGLAGHHALITGGGSGLGLATARCFIAAGARVTVVGTNEEKLRRAALDLGSSATFAPFDVTHTSAAVAFAASIEEKFGPISILVNNAGSTVKKPLAEMEQGDFDGVMATHVSGAFALTRAFAPQIAKSGKGSILFTASMASFLGIPEIAGYSAAKAAYVGLVRSFAAELASRNIRVNGVAPGWIDTAVFQKATATDPARRAKIEGRIPMKRLGSPDDIGWAMTYLASPAAAYVNGHILIVDGGALHAF
ncbi:glucose 1-dehydrogenase [Terrarubrum flagellatum]|uniref:SDR family NAD(P)-dependent oxidoreductase n=1 Tax=Terrirubrum flagellatum TaxID=2895980 RepID=UPI0031453BF2